jgi:hypothetical protein
MNKKVPTNKRALGTKANQSFLGQEITQRKNVDAAGNLQDVNVAYPDVEKN